MRRVIFLPGCLGTALYRQGADPPGVRIWANPGRLLDGGIRELELNRDNSGNPAGGGVALMPARPLEDYYETPLDELQDQLGRSEYSVEEYGFDWRKDMTQVASDLAFYINRAVTVDDPCTLIGHSQGGCIARLAYYYLDLLHGQDRVRRIITVGTPHFGLYNPINLWSGENSLPLHLAGGSLVLSSLTFRLVGDAMPPYEIRRIAGTWGSLYQLMPWHKRATQEGDPNRGFWFNPASYDARLNLDLDKFTTMHDFYVSRMEDPKSIPVGDALVTIAGTGQSTPIAVNWETVFSPKGHLFDTDYEGDDSVHKRSALMPTAEKYEIPGEHVTLFTNAVQRGLIARLVKEGPQGGVPGPADTFVYPTIGFISKIAPGGIVRPDEVSSIMQLDRGVPLSGADNAVVGSLPPCK